MLITAELLEEMDACPKQVALFAKLYPNGLELPSIGKRRAEILEQAGRQGLEVVWWLRKSKQSGVAQRWYENGQQEYRDEYKNGKRHGVCEWWYENGQQWHREEYKNGERHGICEWWYENGQQGCREEYKNGERHGICEGWHENGQHNYRDEYKNGVFVRELMDGGE